MTLWQIEAAMLKEIHNVKQDVGSLTKRWFSDNYFDLLIWESDNGQLHSFQLCYDKGNDERAFCWTVEKPVTHHKVDEGDGTGVVKGTPVLIPEKSIDGLKVLKHFIDNYGDLDKKTAQIIVKKIYET